MGALIGLTSSYAALAEYIIYYSFVIIGKLSRLLSIIGAWDGG